MTPRHAPMFLALLFLLAASPAAVRANDDVGARAVAEADSAVNDIVAFVGAQQGKERVAARLARFYQTKESENGPYLYIGPGVDENAVSGSLGMIRNWVGEQEAAKLAVLYWVLGDEFSGALEQAAASRPRLRQLGAPREEIEGEFRQSMQIFSTKHAVVATYQRGQVGVDCNQPAGPNSGTAQNGNNWMLDYLECAAKIADRIFTASKVNRRELLARIARLERGIGIPGMDPVSAEGPGSRRPFAEGLFGFEATYLAGAEVRHLLYPGDEAKPADQRRYRTIAIKVFDVRQPPPAGPMVQKVGVWDVTTPGSADGTIRPDIVGQEFDAVPGEHKNLPWGARYRLVMTRGAEGQLDIQFGYAGRGGFYVPSDSALARNHGPVSTNLPRLYQMRAEHIRENGMLAEVGGQKFRVIGQGGRTGKYLYFAADAQGNVIDPNRPRLIGEVSKVGADGLPERLEGDQYLGTVRDGSPDHWYLTWKHEQGHWDTIKKDGPPRPQQQEAPAAAPAQQQQQQAGAAPATTSQPPAAGTTSPEATTRQGASDDIAACSNANAFQMTPRTARLGGKDWTYWPGDGAVYLCLFGNAYLFESGYLADIRLSGDEMQLVMVGIAETVAGLDRVDPAHIREGKIAFDRGGGRTENLTVSSYRIIHIKTAEIKRLQGQPNPAQPNKIAWLIEHRNKLNPEERSEFDVFTDADGMARINAAMAQLGNSRDSRLFGGDANAGNRAKLQRFAQAAIAAQGSEGNTRPFIKINLHVVNPQQEAPVVIFTNRAGARSFLKWVVPRQGEPHLENAP